MNLHDYIKPLKKRTKQPGNSVPCQCGPAQTGAYGHRRPNAALAIRIERESSGTVKIAKRHGARHFPFAVV
jgi:hypothetical protein